MNGGDRDLVRVRRIDRDVRLAVLPRLAAQRLRDDIDDFDHERPPAYSICDSTRAAAILRMEILGIDDEILVARARRRTAASPRPLLSSCAPSIQTPSWPTPNFGAVAQLTSRLAANRTMTSSRGPRAAHALRDVTDANDGFLPSGIVLGDRRAGRPSARGGLLSLPRDHGTVGTGAGETQRMRRARP